MERRKKDVGGTTSFDELENNSGIQHDLQDDIPDTLKKESRVPLYIFAVILSLCMLFFATVGPMDSRGRTKNANPPNNPPLPKNVHNIITNNNPEIVTNNNNNILPESSLAIPSGPDLGVEVTSAIVAVPTLSKLKEMALINKKCISLIKEVRDMKGRGVVMETNEQALQLTNRLQNELRKLFAMRFASESLTNPILVEMLLTFPSSMPDFAEKGATGRIIIEMAPTALVPYSVYNFLEIVRRFKSGAFHRNAGHVLQAMANLGPPASAFDRFTGGGSMAFQEYHPGFPHKKFTLGYAGRPGGPAFYVSTVDNSVNHGPASQGSKTEADACFGRLHDEESEATVRRMQQQPGAEKGLGFVSGQSNFIVISSLRVLSPPDEGSDIPLVDVWEER